MSDESPNAKRTKLAETVNALNTAIAETGNTLFGTFTSRNDSHAKRETDQRERSYDSKSPTDREDTTENAREIRGENEHTDRVDIEREIDSSAGANTRIDDRTKEQYLTPQEQVIQHLSTHTDGQVWQNTIVDEMGWSASKTSRVLSTMEKDERIHRYRIGKQKRVYLPGAEPEVLTEWAKARVE